MKNIFTIIMFLVLTLTVLLPSYADPPLPTPIGRVVWVKGTFKAVMPSKEERVLQKTSLIYLHDLLETDANSQAQIVFTDNSLMTFRENTQYLIDEYKYDPKKKSAGKFVTHLIEGGFRTITGFIAKQNPTDYQVNTPVATIGVRGTEYSLYYRNGETFIGYYKGTPCVTSGKADNKQTLCLDPTTKYATVPSAGSAPVPLSQQPPELSQQLTIIPATIAPFTGGGGSQSGGGSVTPSGNSFCIS